MLPDELDLYEFLLRRVLKSVHADEIVYVMVEDQGASPELLSRFEEPGLTFLPGPRPESDRKSVIIEAAIDGEIDSPLVACTCGWYAGPVASATEVLSVKRTPEGWVYVETKVNIIS